MSSYEQVTKELAKGTEPAVLCATCPWDRNCVNPPSVSTADVEKAVEGAAAQDELKALAARIATKKGKPG